MIALTWEQRIDAIIDTPVDRVALGVLDEIRAEIERSFALRASELPDEREYSLLLRVAQLRTQIHELLGEQPPAPDRLSGAAVRHRGAGMIQSPSKLTDRELLQAALPALRSYRDWVTSATTVADQIERRLKPVEPVSFDWNTSFEWLAAEFYRETGLLPPGKSIASEAYAGEEETQAAREAWKVWMHAKSEQAWTLWHEKYGMLRS